MKEKGGEETDAEKERKEERVGEAVNSLITADHQRPQVSLGVVFSLS